MGIPVTVILDSAVGYYMERVDLVLLGAEGVVESGGIVNKVWKEGVVSLVDLVGRTKPQGSTDLPPFFIHKTP